MSISGFCWFQSPELKLESSKKSIFLQLVSSVHIIIFKKSGWLKICAYVGL
jgi:hypothetical protein